MQQIEIRDLRNGDWYWVHKTVLEKYASKIGSTGIAIYNALCYFSNQHNQSAFPSYKTIGKFAGCSEATVKRVLPVLEKNKLVQRAKRGRYSYIYTLLKIAHSDLSQNKIAHNDLKIAHNDLPDSSKRPTNKNYLTRIKNKRVSFKKNTNFRPELRNASEVLEEKLKTP